MVLPAVFPTGTVITKLEQTQTSTEDGGENIITAELFNGEKVTFKVRNGRKGGAGRINKVQATVDANVGTPEVTVKEGGTPENKELTLHFKNMKGEQGTAAGFGTPTASVDNAVGTPEVTVSATGPDTDKQFHFDFKNLKGEQGKTGDAANIKEITASVDNAVGTPEVTVSATGEGRDKSVHFDFKNLKGDAGEKGGITVEEEERVVQKATDNAVRACHVKSDPHVFCYRGQIDADKLNTATAVGMYRVAYPQHQGALLAFDAPGSVGYIQFLKEDWNSSTRWKYRNAVDNNLNGWNEWQTLATMADIAACNNAISAHTVPVNPNPAPTAEGAIWIA